MALPKKHLIKKILMALPNSPSGIMDCHWPLPPTPPPPKKTYGGNQKVVIFGSIFWFIIHKPNGQNTTKKKKKKSVSYIKWNDHFNFILKTNEQYRQQYCISFIKFAKTRT